jgi:hypothetical protein
MTIILNEGDIVSWVNHDRNGKVRTAVTAKVGMLRTMIRAKYPKWSDAEVDAAILSNESASFSNGAGIQ